MDLLYEPLRSAAARLPAKTALIDGSDAVTYEALDRRVRRLAGFLADRFQPGARFGVLLPNSPAAVIGLYAAPAAGLIAVPMDADIHPGRAAGLVEDCKVSAVLTDERHLSRLPLDIPFVILADGRRSVRNRLALESVLASARNEPGKLPERSADDVACILYTAGTTGRPKGVMLTHGNLAAAVSNILGFTGLDANVVECLPMPLSHSFGFARLRSVLQAGATALLEPGFLRPERLIERMKRHQADSLASVPAGLAILLGRHLEAFRAAGARLRFIEVGSAPLSAPLREALLEACPSARIVMHYGLTESSRAAFLDLRAERDRWATVGRPAAGVTIRIAGEPGPAVGARGEGEILIRGKATAPGYWGRPEATAAAFEDGWLRTRDLGFLDADGYLHLSGRAAEMINLGGLKVAPVEVEDVLARQAGIREAAVVGVAAPDEPAGIVIKAFLVLADGAAPASVETLKRACLAELEAYKVPREFEIVRALPRTPSGKVRKEALGGAPGGGHE